MNRLGNFLPVLFLASIPVTCSRAADTQKPPQWNTGPAFHNALASQFSVVSLPPGSTLRDRLQRLSDQQRVAIFLDRRVDPDRSIELSARDITLEELLQRMAAQCGAGISYVGSVAYVGPRDKITGLSRESEQQARDARTSGGELAKSMMASRRWGWDDLAQPRDLIAQLAREADVTIEGIDRIPHDLWPGTELPPLRWTDRLTIVLAGFGLTYELDRSANVIRLVPFLPTPFSVRSYPAALSQMDWDRISQQFPEAKLERSVDGITLEGTREEHERLSKLLDKQKPRRRAKSSRGKQVHTLRVIPAQPIGAILKSLEKHLQLRFVFESELQERLHTPVSFDLRDQPLEEILRATLAPASLTFSREGQVIRITLTE